MCVPAATGYYVTGKMDLDKGTSFLPLRIFFVVDENDFSFFCFLRKLLSSKKDNNS